MTLNGLTSKAVPVAVGVSMVFLAVRFMGDAPIIKDIKEGIKGNSVGLFK